MSYYRMLCIVENNYLSEFASALGDFNSEKIHKSSDFELFCLEGRYFPEVSQEKTLLLGVSGRNATWVKRGNDKLAAHFNARIELCVGFAVENAGYLKLKNKKIFKDCIKAIHKHSGEEFYPNDDADYQLMRIDMELGVESEKIMDALQALGNLFEENEVQFRVAYFLGEDGVVEGDLDDDNDFFGPAAYAKASWDVEVLRTETVEIIVNDSEVIF